ncbi:MAG: glycosyltransferase [Xanthomonadales bacterium]|nr:glycosyltransferase [Xanthomonadales bacterium]
MTGEASESATPDVSVLVPVFNEVEGIERCHREIVSELARSGYSFEIVFVDDGSNDGSYERLLALAGSDNRVTVVKLLYNIGQQRAMYTTLGYCHGKAIITFDSDLQFHVECLPRLAAKILEGYDIAGGIRVNRRDPLLANRLPSWVGRKLINVALRIEQVDFGGVKAYSARLIKTLLGMHAPLIIIPAMAYSISRKAIEIPVRHEERQTGYSKWSILSRMELYLDIDTLYARRPFAWMLTSGVGLIGTSIFLGLCIVAYRLLVSEHFSGLIIFFDVFLLATGIFLFSQSLIGEFVVRNLRGGRFDPSQVVESVTGGRNPGSG